MYEALGLIEASSELNDTGNDNLSKHASCQMPNTDLDTFQFDNSGNLKTAL